ncbi:Cell cycle control protein [Phytophthora megakarya]|uniref:Cell cycle control protein n=1 Tax=Phytophthora megakarya TaxID=4795 RepID=A0A225WVR8_9STRA|nr:Cell cycle control protein [Phytophthora megakarya]
MEVNLVRILPTEGAPLRWEVQHRGTATTHNHPPSTGPSEHPTLRQHLLTDAIRRVIAADSQAGVPVSKTLARLALEAPTVVLVPNDVYNERRKLAENPLEGELPPPTEVPVYEPPPLLLQSRIPLDLSGIRVTPTTAGSSTETGTERPAPTRNPLPDPLLNSSTGEPRPAWMFPCYPEHFFESPGAARAAVNTFAARHGYAVVQKSCIYDKKKRIRRVVLGCDRHGTKRAYASTSSAARQRKKPSRRCGCPMEVHLMRILPSEGGREQWQVQHRGTANEHNHPPSEGPSAHPILRRGSRTDAARQIIAADAAAGISVPQTLSRLAVEAPGVVMTRTDVLNERTKIEVRASEAE